MSGLAYSSEGGIVLVAKNTSIKCEVNSSFVLGSHKKHFLVTPNLLISFFSSLFYYHMQQQYYFHIWCYRVAFSKMADEVVVLLMSKNRSNAQAQSLQISYFEIIIDAPEPKDLCLYRI